jgi:hypothetical protein
VLHDERTLIDRVQLALHDLDQRPHVASDLAHSIGGDALTQERGSLQNDAMAVQHWVFPVSDTVACNQRGALEAWAGSIG